MIRVHFVCDHCLKPVTDENHVSLYWTKGKDKDEGPFSSNIHVCPLCAVEWLKQFDMTVYQTTGNTTP